MKSIGRLRFGVCLASCVLLVGCVPYQTYQQARLELENALSTNADLVKKYNRLVVMQKDRAGGEVIGDDAELRARLAELERENANLNAELANTREFTREELERLKTMGVQQEPGGGLRLGEALLFNPGSDKLKPDAFRLLDSIAEVLRAHPDENFVIEGHTDNQPLKVTFKEHHTNMNLGAKRAMAVFNYFVDNGIVSEDRMVVTSFSYNRPVNPASANSTPGRAENRRVVVRLAQGRTNI